MVMTIGLKYTLGSRSLRSGSCEISDLFTDTKKRFESGEKQESPDYAGTYIELVKAQPKKLYQSPLLINPEVRKIGGAQKHG